MGYQFHMSAELAQVLRELATNSEQMKSMGQASKKIISEWRLKHPAATGYDRALKYALGLSNGKEGTA